MTAGFEQIIGDALHAAGWHLIVVPDIPATETVKASLIHALAAAAGFPSWAGSNWDATEELLTDFSWLDTPPAGFALVLPSLAPIAEIEPKTAETLSAILGDVTHWWGERNVPFVVLHRPAPTRLDSETQ